MRGDSRIVPPPKHRMFGSRTVPKVAKYAVVIYQYTDESKYDCHTNHAQMVAKRNVRKMITKLIERLKKQPHYDFETGNIKQSAHLEYMLKDSRKRLESGFGVFMLMANQAAHQIIHHLAQDYDPNDLESKKCDFYKEIFEELTK